ncbi:MAG: GGDEF domain-containing protein [Clostridiales bacterium]|nr:GGDEF domain-containing protein [Clostridiales bacterium]
MSEEHGMEAILYAEIYLICVILDGILFIWIERSDTNSTSELWLKRVLLSFLLNFVSNFLFTIFNRVIVIEAVARPLSYAFKTAYFITLVIGTFCWCGYAQTSLPKTFGNRAVPNAVGKMALAIGLAMPALNLFTGWLFDFSDALAYQRHFLFHIEMGYLFLVSLVCSVRLIRQSMGEADLSQQSHLRLTATFPLCLLAALILSFAGEAVPVICVSIMVELQCLYMETMKHQISTDKLTQVNNRQNLIGFMNYKLRNHSGDLYLLMIDLDYFKSINDTYGHLEGDRALVELSGALKRACGPFPKRPYIARYGGDEFIVVMEGFEEDVERLCEIIRKELYQINAKSQTYKLMVSIGYAKWQPGMDHKALIGAADEELYRHKRARVR